MTVAHISMVLMADLLCPTWRGLSSTALNPRRVYGPGGWMSGSWLQGAWLFGWGPCCLHSAMKRHAFPQVKVPGGVASSLGTLGAE